MQTFSYPITETSSTKIELDAEGVTVQAKHRGSGRALFSQIAGVYVSDHRGRTLRMRSVALLSTDGRAVEFGVQLNRPRSGGTPGAPVLDHDAAMAGFHVAASSTLRALAQARPDLDVELGMSPVARKQIAIGLALTAIVALALVLFQGPVDFSSISTLVPLLGLPVLIGVYVWKVWLRKPNRAALMMLADLLATQPENLPA